MPTNQGKLKEREVVDHLNSKRVSELPNNLRSFMRNLYGSLDEEEIITCEWIDDSIKPDFVITYKGIKKYISMKSGRAESVHQEKIKTFILFLREHGISKETQKTILLYHYGDGTLDGSGKERYDYNRLRVILNDRIERANQELNASKDFVWETISRCVLLGILENAIPIDGIYFGDYRFGVLATTAQIKKHMERKDWDWMQNLHIGPLQIRPHARYIGKEIKHPEAREKVECYWANLASDIDYISSRYDY